MNRKKNFCNEKYHNNLRKKLQNYKSLICVLRTKNINLIKLALEHSTIDKSITCMNMNPLGFSVYMDNPKIVKLLIDNGFNPNETVKGFDNKKFIHLERPLFSVYHSYKNYDAVIKILVEAGANPNSPDYYCKICDRDGLLCSDEFSHKCNNDVNNLCHDTMIKALCGDDKNIIDCLINYGYNYKNRRLLSYFKHQIHGIFIHNWDTMYRLYSIDEKYFYEELSQDGFFANTCKKYKRVIITYRGDNMTLESFYKSQTKKYHEPTVSLLTAAYYYDENSLLSNNYLCLDMFKLIIKEYERQLIGNFDE